MAGEAPHVHMPPPVAQLPWKSLTSIIEYYYMWKTTDRYVQQVSAPTGTPHPTGGPSPSHAPRCGQPFPS